MSDQVFDFRNLRLSKVSMRSILVVLGVLVGSSIALGSFYQVEPGEGATR